MRALLVVAVFGLATSLAPPALAADRLAVVLEGGCSHPEASSLRGLRDALSNRVGEGVLSEEVVAAPLGGLTKGSISDAEALLSGARLDFYQGSYDRVEHTLKTALSYLTTVPPSEARWKDIREISALLAWSYDKHDLHAEAEAVMREVLRVEPEYVPDPKLYPPLLKKLASQVRAKLNKEIHGTLTISTKGTNGVVSVNGRPMGTTPLTLTLPQSDYRIELEMGERRTLPTKIKLTDSASVELDPTFVGAIHPDEGPCIETPVDPTERVKMLVKLGGLLGVRAVVGVQVVQGQHEDRSLVTSEVDADSGQETREAKVKMNPSVSPATIYDKLAEFLTTGDAAPPLEATLPKTVKVTAVLDTSAPASDKLSNSIASAMIVKADQPKQPTNSGPTPLRIGSYALGGVGVVALLGAGGFWLDGTSVQHKLDQFSDTPSGLGYESGHDTEIATLLSHRSTDQNMAIGFAVGGGVVLAGSAVLFLISGDNTNSTTNPASEGRLRVRPTIDGLAWDF